MSDLVSIFKSIENVKVLIIGDIMLDSYLYGNVYRISPEAPVPVLHKTKEEFKLGGAGNVALNCKELGASVTIMSYIGNDSNGEKITSLLEGSGVKSFLVSNNNPTTVKQRVISGNTHLLRIDTEEPYSFDDYKFNNEFILKYYSEEVKKCDIVILSDYDKGLLNEGNIKEIIDTAKAFDKIVCVDPKINNFKLYKGVDLFKPNLKEAIESIGNSSSDVFEFGSKMKIDMDVDSLMITLSDKGIYWRGNDEFYVDSHKIELADPCGCGDTVLAISSILKYLKVDEKLLVDISNISGSMVCEHFGVVQVKNEDLLDRCITLGLK